MLRALLHSGKKTVELKIEAALVGLWQNSGFNNHAGGSQPDRLTHTGAARGGFLDIFRQTVRWKVLPLEKGLQCAGPHKALLVAVLPLLVLFIMTRLSQLIPDGRS